MPHDPGASDASLHALLLQLMADPHTHEHWIQKIHKTSTYTASSHHVKVATPTHTSQNTPTRELPDYGLGDLEKMATDIMAMESLTKLAQIVAQLCRLMADFKRAPANECIDFLQRTCGKEAPQLHLDHKTLGALGSPEVELALILFQYSHETPELKSLLPPEGSTVIASVATAGSGRPSEWATLLAVLGKKYDLHTVKTVLAATHRTGRTGEKIQAHDESVTYDELAPKDTWPAVSESLYQQFCAESRKSLGAKRAAAIFHWGCISHHDTVTPEGDVVEDWARHEPWNMLDCIAMARHALDFLETGGTLVLKVRIFKDGRTLHLVALLSCAFEDNRIYENSRMPAEFAAFVGLRFKGFGHPDVAKVKAILATFTSYGEVQMTTHSLVRDPTYIETLGKAAAVREKMELHHQHVTFIMQYVIYWIAQACETQVDFDYAELDLYLQALQKDAPTIIDTAWIPDVTRRIKTIIGTMTPENLQQLREYIRIFETQKFRKWPMRRGLHDNGN